MATPDPKFEHGFWYWWDPVRKGWYVGTSPAIQRPSWSICPECHGHPGINACQTCGGSLGKRAP